MHDVGKPQNFVIAFHLNGAEFRNLPDVVPSEIDQHVVLGELLFISEKSFFQFPVLLRRLAPRSRPGKRKGVQDTVLELDQCLRRCPRHFHVCPGEVEHVRGRIQGPQNPVAVEKASLVLSLQPVRQNDLENIPFLDVVLGLPDHAAVVLPVEKRTDFRFQDACRFLLLLPGADEPRQVLQLTLRLPVRGLRLRKINVDDQNDLLAEVVKRNHLVEQHQVHVLEILRVLRVQTK